MSHLHRIQQGRAQKFQRIDAGAVSVAAAALIEDSGLSRPMVEVHNVRLGYKTYQQNIVTHGLIAQGSAPCPRCEGKGRKGEEVHIYMVAPEYEGAGDAVGFCLSCAKREKLWTLQPLGFFGYDPVLEETPS